MLKSPRWTIASVNWNSVEFLDHQLKFFHQFGDNFEYLIVDNTNPSQKEALEKLSLKYDKIRLFFPTSGGLNHSDGLKHCVTLAEGKYILIMDPDFFWMKKSILNLFEHYFHQGYHAIGTEFWDHPFPMPWGAAYYTKEIKDLNFYTKCQMKCDCGNIVGDRWSDTAFEVRIRLQNLPHFGFKKTNSTIIPFMGNHSFAFKPISFIYNGEVIAHHLMRGEYPFPMKNEMINHQIIESRKKYIDYFWNNLKD